jgi:hypothetical protein
VSSSNRAAAAVVAAGASAEAPVTADLQIRDRWYGVLGLDLVAKVKISWGARRGVDLAVGRS